MNLKKCDFILDLLFPVLYFVCQVENRMKPICFYTEEETIRLLKKGYSFGRLWDG